MTPEEQARLRDVLHLKRGDRIVSAWAADANTPHITVLVERRLGIAETLGGKSGLRIEAVYRSEQTPEMISLFDVCAAANKSLMDSLKAAEVTR